MLRAVSPSTASGRLRAVAVRAGRVPPPVGWAVPGGSGTASAEEVRGMAPPATSGIPPIAPSLGPTAVWLGNRSDLGG